MTNYTLLSCIESKRIDSTLLYGRFVLGHFAKGQGLTIANSLRRSLLSQVIGTAIYFAQIKGGTHEYDTLPGVQECVLDLLLNLRQITLTSDVTFFNSQMAYINVQGPGTVRARDLKLPQFISVVNPNQYIATVSPKSQLNIKLLIGCGKTYLTQTPSLAAYDNQINKLKNRSWFSIGYQPLKKLEYSTYWQRQRLQQTSFESKVEPVGPSMSQKTLQALLLNKEPQIYEGEGEKYLFEKTESLGYFPIDAIFAPVAKVNYTIEAVNPTHEKIYLEIWTNGSIDPRNAIHHASKALIDLFLPLQTTKMNPLPTGLKPDRKAVESVKPLKSISLRNRLILQYRSLVQSRLTSVSNPDFSKMGSFDKTVTKIKSFSRLSKSMTNSSPQSIKPLGQWEKKTWLVFLKKSIKGDRQLLRKIIKGILKPEKVMFPVKNGYRGQLGRVHEIVPLTEIEQAYQRLDPKSVHIDEGDVMVERESYPKKALRTHSFIKQKSQTIDSVSALKKGSNVRRKGLTKAQKEKIQDDIRLHYRTIYRKLLIQQSFQIFKTKMLAVELNNLRLPSYLHLRLKANQIHTIKDLVSVSKRQLSQMDQMHALEVKKIQVTLKYYLLSHLI